MKYQQPILILVFVILSQSAYTQNESIKDPITRAIEKHGKAFLNNKNITAVSIGLFKDREIYTRHFGELEKGKDNTPTNETIYEIASVSKTMTGYLVSQAVLEGKIKLEDDIRLYLNGDYTNLSFNSQAITMKHLLTHTSGLPMSLPVEMNGVFQILDENVPSRYFELEKAYDKETFLADLKNVSLGVVPGSRYAYSNVGAELIGYILETVYKKNIDELLKESFLIKSGMLNTAIELTEAQEKNLVGGYWMNNEVTSPNQVNKLWATAGGVKMNLSDMVRYIELQLNSEDPIVSESHKVLYEEGKTLKIAYFWRVWTDKYGISYNHHGGTTGTQNWLFIFPDHQLGISIITNQSGPKTPNLLSKTVKRILKDILKV